MNAAFNPAYGGLGDVQNARGIGHPETIFSAPLAEVHGRNIRHKYDTSSVFHTAGALTPAGPSAQYNSMPNKLKKRRPTYIKEWRKHRNLTQEQLAEHLDLTQATIQRIEKGIIAYTQPVLEAMADVLRCEPADLITRAPGATDRLRDALEGMSPETQKKALAVVKALRDEEAA